MIKMIKKAFMTPYKPLFKPDYSDYKDMNKVTKITSTAALAKSDTLLKEISRAATLSLGKIVLGHVNNGLNSLLNNSKQELPYVERESNKNLLMGSVQDNTKIYRINFHIGYSATKSVLAAESQFGSSNLELTNSQSDGVDNISRSNLSKAFGFNQKRIDFLGFKFYGVVNDYNKIYKVVDWKGGQHSREVPYGLVKQEKSYLKIRNSNAYHAINIKISLVKILDDDVDMSMLYTKTFNKDYNIQDSGTVPCAYQIVNKDSEDNDFMNTILSYPSLNVNMSSNFKVQAKIVKTFSKMLNPGDTLDFRMTHHCGPGIRFDIAQSYMLNTASKGTQPSSFGMIVEAFGTPCEGVRYKDNAVFQGTSPGYYNYEYKKQILAVKHSNLVGSVNDIKLTNIDKKYAIKIYERVFLEQRPFHINVGDIGERGQENISFGVLSTSAIKPVYSQNIIEGDKPELYKNINLLNDNFAEASDYESIKEVNIDLEDNDEDF